MTDSETARGSREIIGRIVDGSEPRRSAWWKRLGVLLAHPRLPLVVALLAFALVLPSLRFGYLVDDNLHAYFLRGGDVPGGPRGIWDLYRFADGGEGTRRAIDAGQFPWWASPDLRFGFMRPLSSLWVAFDHLVVGPFVGHLASCVAYGLLVYVVAKLFARFAPGAAAGLAALMFAVDDAHHFPVLWIANRHALTSALLGLSALYLHVRRREDAAGSWLHAPVLAPFLLLLGFAAGESTLGVLPYFVAYAWWLDPGGRKKGTTALAPFGFVTSVWALAFIVGRFGTSGSTLYIDPLGQPGPFLRSLPERLVVLNFAQLSGAIADVFPLLPPEAELPALFVAAIVLALVGCALRRLTRHHRAAAPLAFGLVLTLVPCCGTFPSDRLLLLAGLGAFGLIGIAVVRVGREVSAGTARWSGKLCAGFLVLAHVAIAAPMLTIRTLVTGTTLSEPIRRGAASIPADAAIRDETLVIVTAPDALMCTYMFLERAVSGGPTATGARLLAVAQRGTVRMTRTSEDVIELASDAPLNADVFSALYRPDRYRAGETRAAGVLHATVVDVDAEGWPRKLRLRFDEISAERQRWVTWKGRGFVEVSLPAVGETLDLPSTPWNEAMGM